MKALLSILGAALLLSSCQIGSENESHPASPAELQSYKQFLMTENYDIVYHAYSPYTGVQINERTPAEVREQITKIACDSQELSIAKRKQTDYYCIYFVMNTAMGIRVNIRQEDCKSHLTYISRTTTPEPTWNAKAFDSFTNLFPPPYHGKEPCSQLFSEKLLLVLDFYQLKLSKGEQVLSPEGELKELVFYPEKPINGHMFSQIRIGLGVGVIHDPDKDKLWPKNIKQAYAGFIEFIY